MRAQQAIRLVLSFLDFIIKATLVANTVYDSEMENQTSLAVFYHSTCHQGSHRLLHSPLASTHSSGSLSQVLLSDAYSI